MAITGLPVVITETSGLFRPIILFGSNLPREGNETALGIRQRGKTRYYPGSDRPTHQVLGPEHLPIQFGGIFEDRRMGVPGGAMALKFLIDSVVKAGRPCIFNHGPYFRNVRWVSAKFKLLEMSRIGYEIELEVLDDGIGMISRVFPGIRQVANVVAAVASAGVVIGQLYSLTHTWGGVAITPEIVDPTELADERMGEVVSLANRAQVALDAVGAPGSVADTGRAEEALSLIDSAREALDEAHDQARKIDWANATGSPFALLAGPGAVILQILSEMGTTATELASVRLKTRGLANVPADGRLYIGNDGDTLQRLALRFYGAAERWPDIMRANGKDSALVAAGESLLLPNLPAQDVQVVP